MIRYIRKRPKHVTRIDIIKGEGITTSQTLSLHFYVTSRNLARIRCDQPTCEENDPR